MYKKLLYPGIAAALGLIITSGIYLNKKSNYTERSDVYDQNEEPYSMKWAMIDLRTGEYNPDAYLEVQNSLRHRVSRAGALDMQFILRGPDNVGGRTRGILEVYKKPDTLFTGSVTGGLFYSHNGGATWQPHLQFQNLDSSSSLISTFAQDTNSGEIYVGTGNTFDQFYGGYYGPGYGIFKSDDGGANFYHLTSTTPGTRLAFPTDEWHNVNRIKVLSDGTVLAATIRGLRRSTDGGATWDNPVLLGNGSPFPGECADIAVGTDGKVLVSFSAGSVYLSEDGETFEQLNGSGSETGLMNGGARTVCDISASDPDIMHVMFVGGDGCLIAIYKTNNGGDSWFKLLEPFDNFSPMILNSSCQGLYDAALASSAIDPNTIFIGGVELWRYDGSLTRIASEAGGPPFQDVLDNYVHADKHYLYQSPNDKRRVYVTSDGGVSVTHDRGNTWQGLNKGYVSTQYYGITHFNGGGAVMGGTQDNGTLVTLGANSSDPQVGYSVFGNDGIDCDASQNVPVIFATSQNGLVVRVDASAAVQGDLNSQPPFAFLSQMGSAGPFKTVVKLWENIDDPTSKDSIIFSVEPTEFAVATGNGIVRNFNESFTPVQPAADVIENSIEVESSGMLLTVDPANPGELIGDGEGTVTFNNDRSIDISVTFDNAPSENANILVRYSERYYANDVLIIKSDNLRSLQGTYTFEHRLENDLNPGDFIKVQDPVQSFLLSTGDAQPAAGGSIRFYRNVLNSQQLPPAPLGISGISGSITCAEVSNDGDVAFIGTSTGSFYRMSGLQDVYTQEDADEIQPEVLFNIGGPVTGLAIDRNNNNNLVVTGGGFGSSNRVRYSSNALAASPSFSNVHGDLPPMPVYDAEFNVNGANEVLLGTDWGIWSTADITATAVAWTNENNPFMAVPVYDIRQQWRPFSEASNSGVTYVGTFGKGLWESTTLVGTEEVPGLPSNDKFVSNMKVFPNPIQSEGNIAFESSFNGTVNVHLFDINGREINTWTERVSTGNNRLDFTTQTLRSGSYFVMVESDGKKETAKFIVMR